MLEQRFIGNGEPPVLAEEITFDTTDIDDMVRAIDGKDISVKLEDGVVITGKPDLNKYRLFHNIVSINSKII